MRILLIRNADLAGFGGAEELICNTARELESKDYEIIIATALPKLADKARKSNLTVIKSPWIRNQSWHGWKQILIPFYAIWLFRLVIWHLLTIKKYHPDVIHPQNRDDWIAAGIAGRIKGIRVIWSDHADLKHEMKNVHTWYKNWQGKIVLWATRFAETITVDSKAELKDINASIHGALDNKLLVAYNGVFDVEPKPINKIKGSFVFGATSRLMRQKGLFELIESFKSINTQHPETELWLVGDGVDRASLEHEATGYKSIRFFGYVDNPLDYAASFDVYAQPTYTEGFSLSLIEAAMLGLPIIATDVGGNPEIIVHEDTGLLIESHDVDSLTIAMQRLYDDATLRKRLSTNARNRFLREFEFSQLVERVYVPLYNKS